MAIQPTVNRHESLDVLRGVAVLGIFMMNMQIFAMVPSAYQFPPTHMDFSGANQSVWWFAHVFFEMKFITIFSTLFGAGIILMVGEDKPSDKIGLHYRRMVWLLIIGMLHAYFIWFGDILTNYAIIGMLAVLMRGWSPRTMVIVGMVFISIAVALMAMFYFSLPYFPEEALSEVVYSPEKVEEIVATYQAGGWGRVGFNALMAVNGQFGGLIIFGPRTLGLMLIGMALFKSGFITAQWSARSYLIGAVLTLPFLAAPVWGANHLIATEFALEEYFAGAFPNVVASLPIAFGYACVVMLICKIAGLGLLRAPFAAAGRMAFTNYLTQSLIGIFVFTGPPGLGYFGEWERVQQFQLVLGVWALQLVWSVLWLRLFRFGPFEWLWRTLSYGRLQPITKPKAAAA